MPLDPALGIPLVLAVVWPAQAAPLVFASEFAQLSVNAVHMVNRVSELTGGATRI
jgi:hypothetical protein